MKKPETKKKEEFGLAFRPRATEMVSMEMPTEVLDSLNQVAANRDMSVEALLKFYIGQGLRQDVASLFGTRVLETTEAVLARHISSEKEINSIIEEIRAETAPGRSKLFAGAPIR